MLTINFHHVKFRPAPRGRFPQRYGHGQPLVSGFNGTNLVLILLFLEVHDA